MQALSQMTMRQKVIAIFLAIVVIFLLYQVIGMFRGGRSMETAKVAANGNNANSNNTQPVLKPEAATLPKQVIVPPGQDQEMIRQQQEIQAKYVAALNELQSLKLAKEIAEANQAIVAAKLATITAQKGILDLLSQPAPTQRDYAQGLVNPVSNASTQTNQVPAPAIQPADSNITVISVSKLQGKWSAVIGYQGNTYSVSVGDVFPFNDYVVTAIDSSGVYLEKDGVKKKISLLSII